MRRAIDVVGATILGAILSPILAGLGIAIRLTMGKPVLFRQQRPGYKGEPFEVYKFRTMRDAVDADGNELPDEERLTRLGIFMRQLSLDELPQLWNIMRGAQPAQTDAEVDDVGLHDAVRRERGLM